jgi:glycosyltransferase involved in cell wall biosynthesis
LKTSVIVATRNSVDTIDECLSSLMPYYRSGYIGEIVVIDGTSTDGTLEAITRYPVRLMPDPGRGVYNAYEAAWRTCNQDLVMFMDSDAFLERGFFPEALDFFNDKRTGILGYLAHAPESEALERTIGQWWSYNALKLSNNKKPGLLRKLYYLAFGYKDSQKGFTSGPIYMVRRECLEKSGGFREWLDLYDLVPRLQYPGDVYLSRSVTANGWESRWWLNAPACHHPPTSLKRLLKQRFEWGKGDGILLRLSQSNPFGFLVPVILLLGTPVVCIELAIRYRNPRQLVLFPLAHLCWSIGYIYCLRYSLNQLQKGSTRN